MIVCGAVDVGVNDTEQPPAEIVQGELVNAPPPLVLKATVPVTVVFVPAELSVTAAVQAPGMPTVAAAQLTVVALARLALKVVATLLPRWKVLPLYVAVSVVEAVDVGVKLTEQEPAASVHGDPLNVPDPPLRANATVPAGVDAVPAEVSATPAVHVMATFSVAAPQVMLVEVLRFDVVAAKAFWLVP